MTKQKLKNFLVKRKSYLRWSTNRLVKRFFNVWTIENAVTTYDAKKSAKGYLRRNGVKW